MVATSTWPHCGHVIAETMISAASAIALRSGGTFGLSLEQASGLDLSTVGTLICGFAMLYREKLRKPMKRVRPARKVTP
jgi:hypothetical protein